MGAGVGVAPAEIVLHSAGEHGVVGVGSRRPRRRCLRRAPITKQCKFDVNCVTRQAPFGWKSTTCGQCPVTVTSTPHDHFGSVPALVPTPACRRWSRPLVATVPGPCRPSRAAGPGAHRWITPVSATTARANPSAPSDPDRTTSSTRRPHRSRHQSGNAGRPAPTTMQERGSPPRRRSARAPWRRRPVIPGSVLRPCDRGLCGTPCCRVSRAAEYADASEGGDRVSSTA